ERLGGLGALADGLPVVAGAAAKERVAQDESRGSHGESQVVEHGGAAAQAEDVVARVIGDGQKKSCGAPHPAPMIEADAGEFCESDGENREIDAGDAEAKGEIADHRAGRRRGRHRHPQPDPRTDAEMYVERGGGISAEADVERVSQRELAGKAHHDVPGLADVGEIENEDQNGDEVVVDEQRQHDEHGEQAREQDQRAAWDPLQQPFAHDGLLPRMPCGRNSSTSTSSPNANMLLADGVKSNPPSASVTPISTPPSSAPGMEPSHPVMTMTKANRV